MADADTKSPFDKFLDRVKTIFEIIGIPVAAYWAFTHFEQGEAPSLKIRHDIQSELTWFDSTSTDECFGNLDIKIKNIGKVNFDIKTVTLRAWISPPKQEANAVSYFSPISLRDGPPIVEVDIPDQLVGEYRPDQTSHENFIFRFKRNPGYTALIEMEAKLKPTEFESNPGSINEYRWDYLCEEIEHKPLKQTSKKQ